jgi:hypothetical protein
LKYDRSLATYSYCSLILAIPFLRLWQENLSGSRQVGKLRLKDIKMGLREISFEDVKWLRTAINGGTCY